MYTKNYKLTVGGYISAADSAVAASRMAAVHSALTQIAQAIRDIPEIGAPLDPANVVIVLESETIDPGSVPAIISL